MNDTLERLQGVNECLRVNKKTIARNIPPQAVETVREQVAIFHHYQELSRKLVEVSIQVCDLKLKNPDESSSESVKKNTRNRPRP